MDGSCVYDFFSFLDSVVTELGSLAGLFLLETQEGHVKAVGLARVAFILF